MVWCKPSGAGAVSPGLQYFQVVAYNGKIKGGYENITTAETESEVQRVSQEGLQPCHLSARA
eukprot:scaffold14905_cov113-Isochrysis_galbana.AAC.2